jgi:hypothetical protein
MISIVDVQRRDVSTTTGFAFEVISATIPENSFTIGEASDSPPDDCSSSLRHRRFHINSHCSLCSSDITKSGFHSSSSIICAPTEYFGLPSMIHPKR